MKRTLSGILTAVFLFVLCIPWAAGVSAERETGFSDVFGDCPFFEEIQLCCEAGLMSPLEPGRFGPEEPLTKGELVRLVARLYSLSIGGDGTIPELPEDLGSYVRFLDENGRLVRDLSSAYCPDFYARDTRGMKVIFWGEDLPQERLNLEVGFTGGEGFLCTSSGELSERDEILCTSSGELSERDEILCASSGELSERDEIFCASSGELSERDEIFCASSGGLPEYKSFSCASSGELSECKSFSCAASGELLERGEDRTSYLFEFPDGVDAQEVTALLTHYSQDRIAWQSAWKTAQQEGYEDPTPYDAALFLNYRMNARLPWCYRTNFLDDFPYLSVWRMELAIPLAALCEDLPEIRELDALPDLPDNYRFHESETEAVLSLYRRGILNGFDEAGTFGGAEWLTRGQAAAISVRALEAGLGQ